MNRTLLKFYSTKDVLFSSISHTWLQYCNGNIARIGITSRGLEDIGSIDYIMPLLKPRDLNTPFMKLDGHLSIVIDELYHTWNIEGSYSLNVPRYVHYVIGTTTQYVIQKIFVIKLVS